MTELDYIQANKLKSEMDENIEEAAREREKIAMEMKYHIGPEMKIELIRQREKAEERENRGFIRKIIDKLLNTIG